LEILMRAVTLAAVLVAFLVPSSAVPAPLGAKQNASSMTSADEAAIAGVIAQYVRAREARDPEATAGLFTADADQLVSSGEWRRGREAVVKGTMASSAATGGTRAIHVETVRKVGPDVAIVDGRYEISGLAGGATRRMWASFVVVRQDGGWRISAIRNMLPAPPAG
jgi:uncharacterized protein (TIGR02246 family)